jgi:hypothetical protein
MENYKKPNDYQAKVNQTIKSIGGVIALIMVAMFIINLKMDHDERLRNREQTQQLNSERKYNPSSASIMEIASAFQDNEVAASKKYADHYFIVDGEITDISIVYKGEICIRLKDRGHTAQCYFPKSKTDQIATLKKGDSIIIKGRCYRSWLGSATFQDCEIL